jgi:hypothetical protein
MGNQTEMNFFNTSSLTGVDLRRAISSASKQDDKILIYFKNKPGKEFTPSQIWQVIFDESTPLTSCRRSMSVLTRKGMLIKTDSQSIGPFGRPENKWKLA